MKVDLVEVDISGSGNTGDHMLGECGVLERDSWMLGAWMVPGLHDVDSMRDCRAAPRMWYGLDSCVCVWCFS